MGQGKFVPANVVQLLVSHLPPDRVAGGRWLAQRAGQPKADTLLLRSPLLDDNTLVPHEVADVLPERRDLPGIRVLAQAIAEADRHDLTYR